jgi:hypothetical protein
MQPSKVDRVRMEIGDFLLEELKNLKGGKPRRPILSIIAGEGWVTKPVLERAAGIKIGDKEMRKIKLHSRYPCKMKPALEAQVFRRRIPGSTLTALMYSLESGGKLQRNAFGTKLVEILGGHANVTIKNIEPSQKVSRLAASFVLELFDEASKIEKGNLVVPADRCLKLERDSYRRCLHVSGHKGNCKFTPKGSLSMTKASELIMLLTGEDVKKLSGLDDVKVEQGRENFAAMREYVDKQFGVDDPEEAMALKKRVTTVEDFHRTDVDMHLSPQSEYSCSCLTCGFFDRGTFHHTFRVMQSNQSNSVLLYFKLLPDHPNNIVCNMVHKRPCKHCVEGYTIVELCQRKCNEKAVETEGALAKQKVEELLHQIDISKQYLDEYRSHLARLKTEAEFDGEELELLPDDTAKVISDWKMKILACYFCENQARLFGKRGTFLLGFMIISNSKVEEERLKGIKDVKFIFLVTDDTLQNEWRVMCAKSEIYSKHIPKECPYVWFQSDGAGCFSSQLNRVVQPLW